MSRLTEAMKRAGLEPDAARRGTTDFPLDSDGDVWRKTVEELQDIGGEELQDVDGLEELRDVDRLEERQDVGDVEEPESVSAARHASPGTFGDTGGTSRASGSIRLLGPDSERFVTSSAIEPLPVEQYRKLATILHHAQGERNLRALMVTSSGPGEGKSLTAANLALTLSESLQRRVLLVDSDLRRPTLHKLFGVANDSGLTECITSKDVEPELPVRQLSRSLSLVTAGTPRFDPTALLTSPRMSEFVQQAMLRFDWVVIDTPPVGLLADAKLLSGMVDVASLLVVAAGRTKLATIRRAVAAIGSERILGVVLNKVDNAAFSDAADYYRYYQRG